MQKNDIWSRVIVVATFTWFSLQNMIQNSLNKKKHDSELLRSWVSVTTTSTHPTFSTSCTLNIRMQVNDGVSIARYCQLLRKHDRICLEMSGEGTRIQRQNYPINLDNSSEKAEPTNIFCPKMHFVPCMLHKIKVHTLTNKLELEKQNPWRYLRRGHAFLRAFKSVNATVPNSLLGW